MTVSAAVFRKILGDGSLFLKDQALQNILEAQPLKGEQDFEIETMKPPHCGQRFFLDVWSREQMPNSLYRKRNIKMCCLKISTSSTPQSICIEQYMSVREANEKTSTCIPQCCHYFLTLLSMNKIRWSSKDVVWNYGQYGLLSILMREEIMLPGGVQR